MGKPWWQCKQQGHARNPGGKEESSGALWISEPTALCISTSGKAACRVRIVMKNVRRLSISGRLTVERKERR